MNDFRVHFIVSRDKRTHRDQIASLRYSEWEKRPKLIGMTE